MGFPTISIKKKRKVIQSGRSIDSTVTRCSELSVTSQLAFANALEKHLNLEEYGTISFQVRRPSLSHLADGWSAVIRYGTTTRDTDTMCENRDQIEDVPCNGRKSRDLIWKAMGSILVRNCA